MIENEQYVFNEKMGSSETDKKNEMRVFLFQNSIILIE